MADSVMTVGIHPDPTAGAVGPLWLASASPRRAQLLRQLGVTYRQRAPVIDETPWPEEAVSEYVQRIAREKARALWRQLASGECRSPGLRVLAADTTVHLAGEILGKPADEADFRRMMSLLSGRTHQVLSAVVLASDAGEAVRLSISEVRFKSLTDSEIAAYWQTGEPRDKAGGYAIQGFGAVFVEHMAGSYSGVVGLPMFETAQLLQQAGVPLWRPEVAA